MKVRRGSREMDRVSFWASEREIPILSDSSKLLTTKKPTNLYIALSVRLSGGLKS